MMQPSEAGRGQAASEALDSFGRHTALNTLKRSDAIVQHDAAVSGDSDAGPDVADTRKSVDHAAPTGRKTCAAQEPEPAPTPSCRDDADCRAGARCVAAPVPPRGCGSPCPGCFSDQCAKDADCHSEICEHFGEFQKLTCIPRCEISGCAAGLRCEADGHCRVQRCEQSFACGAGKRCNPSAAQADANGCEVVACYEADGVTCPAGLACLRDEPSMFAELPGCIRVACDDPRHPSCPENKRCGAPGYCEPLRCQADSDCDCGVCLNAAVSGGGTCASRLGGCQDPEPVSCPP